MRLTRTDGRACLQVDGHHYDIEKLSEGNLPSDLDDIVSLRLLPRVAELSKTSPFPSEAKIYGVAGPPLRRPRIIFGWGMNFADHAPNSPSTPQELPTLFVKFPSAVTGPYDPIVLPRGHRHVDWEAEIAVVIGVPGRRIPRRLALDHVAGVMCAQDISERHVQLNAGKQFCLGKGFDTFCPWGPALVTLDELPVLDELDISCQVNGELVQQAKLRDMIYDVPAMISTLSQFTMLCAGDVILGGSPAGVGFFHEPPHFLAEGDIVETTIAGIGTLRNRVIKEPEFVNRERRNHE
ncbi:fumarylacetoacetate hydrolase family protein [Nocardia sp. NPDC001965]